MATLLDNSEHKALTTLARMKSFLEISGDRHDTRLTVFINQATGFIERYIKRNLLSQTYTDQEYDGTGSDTLVLRQWPVTTFTRLQYRDDDSPDTDSWTSFDASDYFQHDDGRIILSGSAVGFQDQFHPGKAKFREVPKKYRATFTAGYLIDFANENDPDQHTLPDELEYACMELAGAQFNRRRSAGFERQKVGDLSVTLNKTLHTNKEIKGILDKYRKYDI